MSGDRTPRADNDGPSARTTTVFELLPPLRMKPPISTLSPVSARARVEMLRSASPEGVGLGVGVTEGLILGVGVTLGVGITLGVGVIDGVGMTLGVGVTDGVGVMLGAGLMVAVGLGVTVGEIVGEGVWADTGAARKWRAKPPTTITREAVLSTDRLSSATLRGKEPDANFRVISRRKSCRLRRGQRGARFALYERNIGAV